MLLLCHVAGDEVQVVLDATPFYAEGGGQIGDRGTLAATGGAVLEVTDVQKAGGGALFVHSAVVKEGSVEIGAEVHHPLHIQHLPYTNGMQ